MGVLNKDPPRPIMPYNPIEGALQLLQCQNSAVTSLRIINYKGGGGYILKLTNTPNKRISVEAHNLSGIFPNLTFNIECTVKVGSKIQF